MGDTVQPLLRLPRVAEWLSGQALGHETFVAQNGSLRLTPGHRESSELGIASFQEPSLKLAVGTSGLLGVRAGPVPPPHASSTHWRHMHLLKGVGNQEVGLDVGRALLAFPASLLRIWLLKASGPLTASPRFGERLWFLFRLFEPKYRMGRCKWVLGIKRAGREPGLAGEGMVLGRRVAGDSSLILALFHLSGKGDTAELVFGSLSPSPRNLLELSASSILLT